MAFSPGTTKPTKTPRAANVSVQNRVTTALRIQTFVGISALPWRIPTTFTAAIARAPMASATMAFIRM